MQWFFNDRSTSLFSHRVITVFRLLEDYYGDINQIASGASSSERMNSDTRINESKEGDTPPFFVYFLVARHVNSIYSSLCFCL